MASPHPVEVPAPLIRNLATEHKLATQNEKGERFKALHEREGAFIIPNPWDAGSARLLEAMGFEALATTSSGFAQSLGRMDGSVTLIEKAAHCRALAEATDIPVSADLENGFADDPADVAAAIRTIAETGIAGASIEDFSGSHIYDFQLAVERIQAAVEAARRLDFSFTLTARAENLLRGNDDVDDTIRRLQAFADAGADVLFAPGLSSLEQVRLVTSAVNKPVNVLAAFLPGVTLAQLQNAGAKRISIGGALANAAIGSLLKAAAEMREDGTFGWLSTAATRTDIARLLENE